MHFQHSTSPASVACICQHCGATFYAFRSQLKWGAGKFCCHNCQWSVYRSNPPRKPLAERFWPKVMKTETCWLWIGYVAPTGYGFLGTPGNGEPLGAHRASWELHRGPIPSGMEVCHSCDINYPPKDITYRRCVHPDHLFLGTRSDNMQDMISKGRQGNNVFVSRSTSGERNNAAKLSEGDVMAIRLGFKDGKSRQSLAGAFGVTLTTICSILKRRSWKHVP